MSLEEPEEPMAPDEEDAVIESGRLAAPVVYEIVRRDGLDELDRPKLSLVWSGVAAGIMISFSILAEALLRVRLPDTPWRPLVENLGYTTGFLLTIVGRLQLFTENTITTVIPFCHRPSWRIFNAIVRLWSIVFAANLVGTAIAAGFIALSPGFGEDVRLAMSEISLHMMDDTAMGMFMRGIPAGILIAAIVWMLPSAGASAIWIIVIFTYLIALGDFTHVVAGSTEAHYLLLTGQISFVDGLYRFLVPVLAGNVVGGTAVFSLLAYGQVHQEVDEKKHAADVRR